MADAVQLGPATRQQFRTSFPGVPIRAAYPGMANDYRQAQNPGAYAPDYRSILDSAYNVARAGFAPDYQYLANQRSGALAQYGLQGQDVGLQQQGLQANYDEQLLALNQARGENNIALGAALAQMPYYDQITGLANQLFSSQMNEFGYRENSARGQAAEDRRKLMSDAISRGAGTAPGVQSERGFINSELGNSVGLLNEGRKQAYIGNVEKRAEIEQQANQTRSQIDRLKLESSNFGARADIMARQLDIGIQRLGLQGLMNWQTLMDALNSNDYQTQTLGRQIASQAMQYAQSFAQLGQ